MRRILSLVLALLAVLGLAACAGRGENDARPLYSEGDLEKIGQAGAFTAQLYDLEEVDADTAFMLYRLEEAGLTREDLKTGAALRSAGASCEEAAVLVFAGASQAEAAVEALEGYLQGQIDSNADYRPDEIPKLENALLDRRGESVLLVVAGDVDAAKEAVN